jgi:hypothetical protein
MTFPSVVLFVPTFDCGGGAGTRIRCPQVAHLTFDPAISSEQESTAEQFGHDISIVDQN